MRVTGIVRKIDDLGRIVVPKEVMWACNVKEGDGLEFHVNDEGDIILRKFTVSE